VDTGYTYSIFPFHSRNRPKWATTKCHKRFLQVDVSFPILGVDF
jgi:hypothetical protein